MYVMVLKGLRKGWMSVWIEMIGGLDKYRGEKGLPFIGHILAFCSLLILMFLWLVTILKDLCSAMPSNPTKISVHIFIFSLR